MTTANPPAAEGAPPESCAVPPMTPVTANWSQNQPFGIKRINAKPSPTANARASPRFCNGPTNTSPDHATVIGSFGQRSAIDHTSEPIMSSRPAKAATITPGKKITSAKSNNRPSEKTKMGSCPESPAT